MQEIWEKFERWLAMNWPEGLADLNPPASEEEIKKLEAALGVRLPSAFVSCLKVHNGQKALAGSLLGNTEFLSTEAIFDQWSMWKDLLDGGDFNRITSEPDSGVKDDWWNVKWIPFTCNGSGDHYCIDLDPAEGGTSGQVITMLHDMGDRYNHDRNFFQWFNKYVDEVLDGRYAYSEEYGGLSRVDEL